MNDKALTKTRLFDLYLPDPTILASGVIGTTPGGLKLAIKNGAGGVTTKSLGINPRAGHNAPNVVGVDGGYLNAMGLPNPGVQYFKDELAGEHFDVPVFASIFGDSPEEFAEVARIISDSVDAIELNLSCPHAEKYGASVGSDPVMVERITSKVTAAVDLPVLAKLTPNTSILTEIGEAAESGGADGIVAINTVAGMTIDIKTRKPILGNKSGGLSGPAVHPVAVKAVYDLYEAVSVPIIGVGGVETGESAIELMLAGASAVQIGSGVGKKGISVFKKVNQGIAEYLNEEKLSLDQLVGLAH